jgi:voltage-gated potassium channel
MTISSLSTGNGEKPTDAVNFSRLTAVLVTFLLLNSLAHQFLALGLANLIIEILLILTLATAGWSIRQHRFIFRVALGLAVGVALLGITGLQVDSGMVLFLHAMMLFCFFLSIGWVAARQVLFSGSIEWNTVVGAVCIYLLLGLIWAMVFTMLEVSLPGSFRGVASTDFSAVSMDLLYFSYISLSTMGYGDITPVQPLARYCSFMAGVVGQFYMAVLVASLVGVRVSRWQ